MDVNGAEAIPAVLAGLASFHRRAAFRQRDKPFPASLARRLHGRLPGSSLAFVEGARTYVRVDRPEPFAEHVIDFVDTGP